MGNSVAIGFTVRLLNRLLVCSEIKVDEEEKITCQEGTTENGCVFSTRAISGMGKVWPVVSGEVSIGSEISETNVNYKLRDLHSRQVFLPPNLSAASSRIIIIVHYDVYRQVEDDNRP